MPRIKAYRPKQCIGEDCGRPISLERQQLVGPTRAKTCSPACSLEHKRDLRRAGAARSRKRAKEETQ